MTDSATSALLEDDDEDTGEDLGGLDDLLASLRSDEAPAPKRGRGRAKKEATAKDFKAVFLERNFRNRFFQKFERLQFLTLLPNIEERWKFPLICKIKK